MTRLSLAKHQQAANDNKLAEVIGVVVRHEEGLAQDRLAVAVGVSMFPAEPLIDYKHLVRIWYGDVSRLV